MPNAQKLYQQFNVFAGWVFFPLLALATAGFVSMKYGVVGLGVYIGLIGGIILCSVGYDYKFRPTQSHRVVLITDLLFVIIAVAATFHIAWWQNPRSLSEFDSEQWTIVAVGTLVVAFFGWGWAEQIARRRKWSNAVDIITDKFIDGELSENEWFAEYKLLWLARGGEESIGEERAADLMRTFKSAGIRPELSPTVSSVFAQNSMD